MRRILIGLGVLLLIAGGAVAYVLLNEPGNVSNPDVAFEEETATATPTPAPPEEGEKKPKAKPFLWPTYGLTPDRRRQVSVPATFKAPFKQRWQYNANGVLLEFPPVMSAKSLFLLKDDGVIVAIDKETGKKRWARNVGELAASTPHLEGESLYVTILERNGGGAGRILKLSTRGGRHLWSRNLPSRTESSPIVANDTVYFGSEDGTVYALNTANGATRWTYRAGGAVKGGLALDEGKLYFGDYAGRMTAISAATGKLVWQAKTQGAKFGFASGRFYGTPAVAYGRVYNGNVDGYVYSFSQETGELAWRTKTSGFVYSSPSVGAAPGDKPTVYSGSYDGAFYALDAKTGGVRWRSHVGQRISGPSTIIGDVVYFGDIDAKRTYGLDAKTGKKVFEFPRGGYASVITDRKTLFLVSYFAVRALDPLSAAKQRELAQAKAKRRERAIGRRRDCVKLAKRNYTRQVRQTLAFRRCVIRTNASRIKLRDLAERRRRRQAARSGQPRSSKSRSGRSKPRGQRQRRR